MGQLMNQILSRENMKMAYKKVKANKGAGGIDGISIEDVNKYLKENWIDIKAKILKRKYKPQPVLRVEIPKPNGGVRNLGIPTVVDRIIEQAIAQVLTPMFEPQFSEHSYGFRSGRRAQQAIVELLEYLNDGYTYIVDIDLEKFFDNVPQDKLMYLVGKTVKDRVYVIFDEATSALDNISQKNILKNLKPYLKNKIVIMIAHRLSTIKNVDHIYVLKNGEVVEQGRHPELMNINGLYRKLYNDD